MKQIELCKEDYDFLKELQHELNTQTTDGNAQPVYWGVMETREEPTQEGNGNPYIYIGDGGVLTLKEAVEHVNENIEDYREELQEKWKDVDQDDMDDVCFFIKEEMEYHECRIVWQEEKSFISRETGAFITKRACQKYIENCSYNHDNPRTYAMTAYRNFELERLLRIIREMQFEEEETLTDIHLKRMCHAIGLDNKEPNNGVYEAYRNGSLYATPVEEWEEIVKGGYAVRVTRGKDILYHLTHKGFQKIADVKQLMILYEYEYEPKK